MKTLIKVISGLILIGGFIGLLSYGLNYLQRPSPLENIEKRMDEAVEKEKKLKQESQTKEWEEIDK